MDVNTINNLRTGYQDPPFFRRVIKCDYILLIFKLAFECR